MCSFIENISIYTSLELKIHKKKKIGFHYIIIVYALYTKLHIHEYIHVFTKLKIENCDRIH